MFLYSHWLSLPINTRHKIASEFNIPKKGYTHVIDNEIISDGYIVKDIEEALSVESINKYLNTNESDMAVLWDMLVEELTPPPQTPIPAEVPAYVHIPKKVAPLPIVNGPKPKKNVKKRK